jgi:hypothetical protein
VAAILVLFTGAVTAFASQVPGANIDIGGRNDAQAALSWGMAILCLGVLFVAIPIVVGILTLRNRPAPVAAPGVNVYTPPSSATVYTPPSTPPVAAPPAYTPPPYTPPTEPASFTPPPEEPTPPPDEPIPPAS